MRENYRNSIASIKKFPQFTTMHVIDGQAGLIICASLIFYSLTIDNILNIIVLLILAGISISMLSGDNGILQRATDAKTETEKGQEKEIVALAYNSALAKKISNGDSTPITSEDMNTELTNQGAAATGSTTIKVTFTVSQRQYTITSSGEITYVGIKNDDEQDDNELPTALGTKPYFPSDKFKQLEGTDLSNGLVITDKADNEDYGNEYVWIEVPNKQIDSNATFGPDYAGNSVSGSTDYENIERAMISYVKDGLLNGSEDINTNSNAYQNSRFGRKDEWYDKNNKIAADDEVDLTNTEGCGLTSDKYTELYHKMLKSVYENGGFWIGRYEAGMTGNTGRADANVSINGIVPLSQQDLIPIFNVTCSQAQQIAIRVTNKGNYNSSLMFGIQWDMVLKYLQNKGVSASDITSNSSNWGIYSDTTSATLRGGRYTQYMNSSYQMAFNTWYAYNVDCGEVIKNSVLNNVSMPQSVLLTTGALSSNMNKKNICDLAGNVAEWTLEHDTFNTEFPCISRGGTFSNEGYVKPASSCGSETSTSSYYAVGFRVSLY